MTLVLRYLAALFAALLGLGAWRIPGVWLPRAGALLLALGLVFWLTRAPRPRAPPLWHLAAALAAGSLVVSLEVTAIHAIGLRAQRQPAALILVLGAKVHPDGTPSEALAERVATGVNLYRMGLSPLLFVSGGVGQEGQDEAVVMKRLAMAQGVPARAIVVDSVGNNTEASLRNVRRHLDAHGGGKVLVVSHYHHLPRVKLLGAFHGVECATVPADEGDTLLAGTPFYVLREAAGLAYYLLRG
ncbi:MAG: YdcF family protein [Polyangiaceae bacterium]|nr:YdcF family protein [Polyangiaceae bacterium]